MKSPDDVWMKPENDLKLNNKTILQVAILGMLEDDGLTVHQVLDLTRKAVENVWSGLQTERSKADDGKTSQR